MTKLILSLQIGMFILVAILAVYVIDHSRGVEWRLEELERSAEPQKAPGAPAADGERLAREVARLGSRVAGVEEKVQEVLNTFEWLLVDVDAIKRYAWDTLQALQAAEGDAEPEVPEKYVALFNPETRDALKALAAEKGIRLLDDRVEVPAVVIQNRAMLEFVAVVSGGKEHEAIVAVTGSYDRESRKPPEGLAVMMNACILSLGFTKGTPVRVSQDGKVMPPEGETVYVYLEWKDPESGEAVRARAEDLVYNIETRKTMARKKWVYVGSRFEKDPASGDTVYLAEVTGDVVATYSWPNTIIDNTTSEGSDDIYYTCCTPRIPPIGTKVDLVISKSPLAAKDFPGLELPEDDAEDPGGGGDDK